MPLSYSSLGLSPAGRGGHRAETKDLQRDLRALGYLHSVIDGDFGPGTEKAVRALQIDLLSRDDRPTAPVAVSGYAAGRAVVVSGTMDADTALCVEAMLADPRFQTLPRSPDPRAENARVLAAVAGIVSLVSPTPFMRAIFLQESQGRHFHQPLGRDEDDFVTVGLDYNDKKEAGRVTSRGYGIGQFTIRHHPPARSDVEAFVLDPVANVGTAFSELREKLDRYVAPTDGSGADDRLAEHPGLPLRLCKYKADDPRYLRDCVACARAARGIAIPDGAPVHPGAALRYAGTQYHRAADYAGVPDRAGFACDWPYAVRRYNGAGPNSYHYQTKVLLRLLALDR